MAKKEAQTDIWVYDLLKSAHITLEYQGSTISEIEGSYVKHLFSMRSSIGSISHSIEITTPIF